MTLHHPQPHLSSGRGSSTTRLFLSRHGQSEYNVREQLGGDSAITRLGEAYAQLLPTLLQHRLDACGGGPLHAVPCWTSTLRRTILTARHLPCVARKQWKELDEISAGDCDGMTYEEVAHCMPHVHQARKRDKLRYRYPGGESYMDVDARLQTVLRELRLQQEAGAPCICIVSHQAVLRVLYGRLMGLPEEQIPNLEVPLHTLIELTPQDEDDGGSGDAPFHVQLWVVDPAKGPEQFAALSPAGSAASDMTDVVMMADTDTAGSTAPHLHPTMMMMTDAAPFQQQQHHKHHQHHQGSKQGNFPLASPDNDSDDSSPARRSASLADEDSSSASTFHQELPAVVAQA